jgi:hypothetical protein
MRRTFAFYEMDCLIPVSVSALVDLIRVDNCRAYFFIAADCPKLDGLRLGCPVVDTSYSLYKSEYAFKICEVELVSELHGPSSLVLGGGKAVAA